MLTPREEKYSVLCNTIKNYATKRNLVLVRFVTENKKKFCHGVYMVKKVLVFWGVKLIELQVLKSAKSENSDFKWLISE